MSRYINADLVKVRYRGGFYDDYVVDYDSFTKAPSIDIIRCKECELFENGWCNRHDVRMNADDFCSYGEREK